jgi:small subunit ribosomal protein S6
VNRLAEELTQDVAEEATTDTDAPETGATETAATASEAIASDETTSEENTSSEAESETASEDTQADSAPAEAPSERPVRTSSHQPELSDALSPTGGEQTGPRKEVEDGRAYEIIYIAKTGDQAANDATVESLKSLIDGLGGAVDNVRSTEVRRLAYPIKREIEGIYYVVNTRFTTEHMSEVDRFFKLEESVIRHMIIREDS